MSKILVDVDGVIVKYNFGLLVKKYFGIDLSPMSIYAYDLADVLGVSEIAINTMFKEQVYGRATFMPSALSTLQSWYNKHEIIIGTNRTHYMTTKELVTWLTENNIPFHGIDETLSDKYDFHIDDSPRKLAGTNSQIKLLFNAPWNTRCLDIQKKFKRVFSWDDIAELVAIGDLSENI
jgi:uncharacterized HAD superfamily protein